MENELYDLAIQREVRHVKSTIGRSLFMDNQSDRGVSYNKIDKNNVNFTTKSWL